MALRPNFYGLVVETYGLGLEGAGLGFGLESYTDNFSYVINHK